MQPAKWTAPEAIVDNKYSVASDVWSFGVTVVEIVQDGGGPYPQVSNPAVMEMVVAGARHPQPPNCSDVVYAVLLRCWAHDPANRPDFVVLADEFLLLRMARNSILPEDSGVTVQTPCTLGNHGYEYVGNDHQHSTASILGTVPAVTVEEICAAAPEEMQTKPPKEMSICEDVGGPRVVRLHSTSARGQSEHGGISTDPYIQLASVGSVVGRASHLLAWQEPDVLTGNTSLPHGRQDISSSCSPRIAIASTTATTALDDGIPLSPFYQPHSHHTEVAVVVRRETLEVGAGDGRGHISAPQAQPTVDTPATPANDPVLLGTAADAAELASVAANRQHWSDQANANLQESHWLATTTGSAATHKGSGQVPEQEQAEKDDPAGDIMFKVHPRGNVVAVGAAVNMGKNKKQKGSRPKKQKGSHYQQPEDTGGMIMNPMIAAINSNSQTSSEHTHC